ncbi:MAG: bifunctional DNA-formamidopyrimidine glycosylase/DNA-(apurinic or apyrimidinic site) lyase [Polyangia bacterium]
MPELPEVETVVRQLDAAVAGRRLREIEVFDEKLDEPEASAAAGTRVLGVRRVGKRVVFDLARPRRRSADLYLVVHLRMTGRLLLHRGRIGEVRHLRAVLRLDRGRVLFVDTRRFGTMRLCGDVRELEAAVDPLDPRLDARALRSLIGGSPTPLKPWLMRQDRLGGIGNIYAAEICHLARLDPRRPAGGIDARESRRLLESIRAVLEQAIEDCGTTFSDYRDSNGEEGGYAQRLAVYAREGEPCGRRGCPGTVRRIVQQQRATFFCPRCQR